MRYNRRETVAEARRILALAWPITLTSLNWTLMHLVDVIVVGQVSTFELAALAAGRTLTFISIVMGLAGLSGVLVFTARADGGGRLAETGDIWRGGVLLGFAIGCVLLAVLTPLALPLLGLIGVAPELREPGAAVVRAIALGYPVHLVLSACSFFLEGISRPRRVLAVNFLMLPLNAFLAWALAGGQFGLPALGAVGAALATAATSLFGAAAMLWCCWSLPRAQERGVRDLSRAAWSRALRWQPQLARFALVPALAAGLELAGFSWLIALSTQLGMITAAAFQAMFSLHNLVFALAMGFGSAAGVRVGNAIGADERHDIWPRVAIAGALAMLVLGSLSAVMAVFALPIVAPFSDDRAVVLLAAAMLVMMAPFMLFDGLQYVFHYALRSMGEQVWAGINAIIGFFIVTGTLGWWMIRDGWGASGLVYAGAVGMVVTAALQFARLAIVLRRPPARS